ncbi:hypothetical protein K431DRAFT_333172 [Polychaeton citri CBS 116435]|uniref:Uncharacterized protein n=1 Tax=Polychaeton citri CBS 116435 TaxID=1314669 RepID=A0A9P4Q1P8_9PEZI|nr:hypothetical protein K431DRAFT_333172 [Polychaeton citri CBS 116435]
MLIDVLLNMTKVSTGPKYDLIGTYGPFLNDVPQRLGANEALDSAAKALVHAHCDLCLRRPVTVDSLTKYTHAIQKIRTMPEDSVQAQAIETSCAVILLLIRQNLSGFGSQDWTTHFDGASQLLLIRNVCVATCAVYTNTCIQVVRSLFDRSLRLNPSKFEALISVPLLHSHHDDPITNNLSRVLRLLERGSASCYKSVGRKQLKEEASAIYRTLFGAAEEYKSSIVQYPGYGINTTTPYGASLAVCCMFSYLLRGLGSDEGQLLDEGEMLVDAKLALAR